ncbi:MAG: hypothetical protein P1V35_13490 [Planctomycetota bacterium]|nr:hypothetical protein [Planctomycetota bacterium]
MRLEDYDIEPRRRTEWEVMDLGTLLLQRNFAAILRSSVVVGLPILAITVGLVVGLGYIWAYLFLWLMRPLYGRVTLHILSRAVFASYPTPREVARALPKVLSRGFWTAVLIRPFTLSRVLVEPVLLLEGLRGKELRRRSEVLLGEGVRGGIWWGATAVFLVQISILASLAILFLGFAPAGLESLEPDSVLENPLVIAALALSFAVVEPLWVAVGFATYLNRRSDLEGWDVELVFRRLAQRASQGIRLSSVALLAVFALWPGLPQEGSSPVESVAQRPVDVVFARDEFKTTRTVEMQTGQGPELPPALIDLFGLVAWILLAVLVAWILFLLARWAMGLEAPEPRIKEEGEGGALELAGLDLRRESLPRDVVGEARSLWEAGQVKGAVSLLYRASLVVLRDRHGLFIEDGDTEGRCLRKVTALEIMELGTYFGGLTDRWTRLAYGGESLDESSFAGLAKGYGTHFGGRR